MKIILTLTLFITTLLVDAQTLHINPGCDTTKNVHQRAIEFFKSYLKSGPSNKSTDYLKFWNPAAKAQWKHPDLALNAINGNHSIFQMGYSTLLSITPVGEYFKLQTVVGWKAEDINNINLLCIVNHYLKPEGDSFLLYQNIQVDPEVERDRYKNFEVIQYKNARLSHEKLEELDEMLVKLKADYGVVDDTVLTIVYGANATERSRLLGFHFNLMNSTNNPSSGISDAEQHQMILNGSSPLLHEAVHIYLNPVFNKSPLSEGIATFYGGSMGNTVEEGVAQLKQHQLNNPDVDWYAGLKSKHMVLSNDCNPVYILEALLVKEAHKRGGVPEIKKMMTCESLEDVFTTYFKVKEEDRLSFLQGLVMQ